MSITAVTGVDSSASSVTLVEANSQRSALTIFNASTQTLYINFDAAASIAKAGYVAAILTGGYYELPKTAHGVSTAKITGIWTSANGFANICQIIS